MMKIPSIKRVCSINLASCIALAISLFIPILSYASPTNRIFILHSYSQEYAWTKGQHEGFMQALTADAQVEPIVNTEYLDTKRLGYDDTYASELARHLRSKYTGYKLSAIYVTDDNALLFARDHLSSIFPGVAVFFSGVNDYGVLNSLDPTLFTGVFERKEVGPNIEWLLQMDKNANDLIFIGDGSNTYLAIESELRVELAPYHLRVTFVAEKSLAHTLAKLRDLPGKYIFLTTLGGMIDENGQVLPLREIMKSLAGTGRIIISMEDAYIIEGVLGGSATSAQKQGMSAARLLLAYQHGKQIVDLPPILKSPNALIFDDKVLQQLGIDLPEKLRSQAVLLHPRLDFYEQYRSLILGMLIGLTVLFFLVVIVSVVILSRKNQELNLARNRAELANSLFNRLAEQSRIVHWEVNAEGFFSYVSPVSYAVLGYRPEELVDKKQFYDLLPGHRSDSNKTEIHEFFTKKRPFNNLENTACTKDGELIWVSTNGVQLFDDSGTFLGFRGSFSDMTERKQAEEALRESEEMYRNLFDYCPMGIHSYKLENDGNLIFQNLNQAAIDILGVSCERFIGKTIEEAFPPLSNTEVPLRYREAAAKGKIWQTEQIDYSHNEIIGAFKVVAFQTKINEMACIFEDVTERKQAEAVLRESEEKLARSKKMESLGLLAGGVAHDLNNVLSGIVSYPELLLMDLPKDSKLRKPIEIMQESGYRASAIVQDLLTVARGVATSKEPLNINDLIGDYLNSPEFKKLDQFHLKVRVKTNLDTDLFNISGSYVHIRKVVMNLVSNASESIEGSGNVIISTINRYVDRPIRGYEDVKIGEYVVLAVSDDGAGILSGHLERIFEPFFTKKIMGRSGTGLGLAVVWNIVQDHKGYVDVSSDENGTTFELYFPITRDEVSEKDLSISIEDYEGGGETVLVVDDVESQRMITCNMLDKLGYKTKAVSSGEEAVAYLQERGVDIILLDMIMDPGINGRETYKRIIKIHPAQKAIIVSGFAETDEVKETQKLGAGKYIKKPLTLQKIGLAIKEELEKS